MCGIVLLYGPNANERLLSCLKALEHRGPDDISSYHDGRLSLGFVRLAINEKSEIGRQPAKYRDLVSVVNGEIFNKSILDMTFDLPTWSDNDCHVVAPMFEKFSESLINHLDGFYAGLIYDEKQNRLYSLRDYIGKKPLFIGRSGEELFIVSELKVISCIDEFSELPLGCCEVNLTTGLVDVLAIHQTSISSIDTFHTESRTRADYSELSKRLEQAVKKRLPEADEPVGVFLSGGLDSSVISSIVSKYRQDAIYYVLADKTSADFSYANQLIEYAGLRYIQYVDLPTSEELIPLIDEVVFATQSYNPSVISNGLCSYLLARAAQCDGLKVVLSGEGADELFYGYHSRPPSEGIRQQLISDMKFTELRRIDLACMAHAIECRCPYLDKQVFEFSNSLNVCDFYGEYEGYMVNKYALRAAFSSTLPGEICWREKKSFDVGSGIRKMIISTLTEEGASEKQALKAVWDRYFKRMFSSPILCEDKYFHSYPVFDNAIAQRGVNHR